MTLLFDRYASVLGDAVYAIKSSGHWSPFSMIPIAKVCGETASADAPIAINRAAHHCMDLPRHSESPRAWMNGHAPLIDPVLVTTGGPAA